MQGAGLTVDSGWGVATRDWDHDGDLDLAMRSPGGSSVTFAGPLDDVDQRLWLMEERAHGLGVALVVRRAARAE